MKKYLTMLLVCSMFLFPMVSASSWVNTYGELSLTEKNPNDWSVVENGANGLVEFSLISRFGTIVQERVKVSVWGLEPKTDYQLIYYGDSEHNDVWNYATCIGKERKTSTNGYFKGNSVSLPYLEMMNDEVAQKLWVVKSSDVDCLEGKMIAWQPTEYLFESNTI